LLYCRTSDCRSADLRSENEKANDYRSHSACRKMPRPGRRVAAAAESGAADMGDRIRRNVSGRDAGHVRPEAAPVQAEAGGGGAERRIGAMTARVADDGSVGRLVERPVAPREGHQRASGASEHRDAKPARSCSRGNPGGVLTRSRVLPSPSASARSGLDWRGRRSAVREDIGEPGGCAIVASTL